MTYIIRDTKGKTVKKFESDVALIETDVLRNYPAGYTLEVV